MDRFIQSCIAKEIDIFLASDGEHPERNSYAEVLLLGRLERAIHRINAKLPVSVVKRRAKIPPHHGSLAV